MQKDFINTLCNALGLSQRLTRVTIEHDFTDRHGLTKITTVQAPPKGEINLPITKQFVLQEISQSTNAELRRLQSETVGFVAVSLGALQYWVARKQRLISGGVQLRTEGAGERLLTSDLMSLADRLESDYPNILIGIDANWGMVTAEVTAIRDTRCVPVFTKAIRSLNTPRSYSVEGSLDTRLIVNVHGDHFRTPDENEFEGQRITLAIAAFIQQLAAGR